MITFHIGRWIITLFDKDNIGYWCWNKNGYDCLTNDWCFGWWAEVSRCSDFLEEFRDPDAPFFIVTFRDKKKLDK